MIKNTSLDMTCAINLLQETGEKNLKAIENHKKLKRKK